MRPIVLQVKGLLFFLVIVLVGCDTSATGPTSPHVPAFVEIPKGVTVLVSLEAPDAGLSMFGIQGPQHYVRLEVPKHQLDAEKEIGDELARHLLGTRGRALLTTSVELIEQRKAFGWVIPHLYTKGSDMPLLSVFSPSIDTDVFMYTWDNKESSIVEIIDVLSR